MQKCALNLLTLFTFILVGKCCVVFGDLKKSVDLLADKQLACGQPIGILAHHQHTAIFVMFWVIDRDNPLLVSR